MKAEDTKLAGCKIIIPDVFGDSRGWFMESFSEAKYEAIGIKADFVQDNHSYSAKKDILRGIHFQKAPYAQAKLVRCTRGRILDVAVDLRKSSPTYCQWIAVELSAENFKQLWIPQGFGHGFVTLSDDCEVQYKTDNVYSKESDRSIRFDDPQINVDWGISEPELSEKDRSAPYLSDSDVDF